MVASSGHSIASLQRLERSHPHPQRQEPHDAPGSPARGVAASDPGTNHLNHLSHPTAAASPHRLATDSGIAAAAPAAALPHPPPHLHGGLVAALRGHLSPASHSESGGGEGPTPSHLSFNTANYNSPPHSRLRLHTASAGALSPRGGGGSGDSPRGQPAQAKAGGAAATLLEVLHAFLSAAAAAAAAPGVQALSEGLPDEAAHAVARLYAGLVVPLRDAAEWLRETLRALPAACYEPQTFASIRELLQDVPGPSYRAFAHATGAGAVEGRQRSVGAAPAALRIATGRADDWSRGAGLERGGSGSGGSPASQPSSPMSPHHLPHVLLFDAAAPSEATPAVGAGGRAGQSRFGPQPRGIDAQQQASGQVSGDGAARAAGAGHHRGALAAGAGALSAEVVAADVQSWVQLPERAEAFLRLLPLHCGAGARSVRLCVALLRGSKGGAALSRLDEPALAGLHLRPLGLCLMCTQCWSCWRLHCASAQRAT